MNNNFSSQVLIDKLSKINNSQQSIESLSSWCISHRKKAKQVVETWEKLFNSTLKEKRVPLMYLANDILQNSRRKGSEFVNEFWKVLPRSLRSVIESGDDHGKSVVTRLVDIWEERKVFGSRGRVLKDEMLSNESKDPPSLEHNGKNSLPFKILKKDAQSLRIKLAVGCLPEKIISAFQSVHDENISEDVVISKCKDAVYHVGMMEKDVEDACAQGKTGSPLENELQQQEAVLKQCVEQLESSEATRAALVTYLNEALQQQESMLENVRCHLHVARAEFERASGIRNRISSTHGGNSGSSVNPPTMQVETAVQESNLQNQVSAAQRLTQPVTSFIGSLTTTEEHKKAAAEVAAKLAAMTSSAQVLTSIFSSLAAEAAASKNGGLTSGNFPSSSHPIFPMEKRPRLEKPIELGNVYSDQVSPQQLPSVSSTSSQIPVTSLQPMIQVPQPPFPPLPPSMPPPSTVQHSQTSGAMMGPGPFVYGGSTLPPPPPPPTLALMAFPRSNTAQTPASQQKQQLQPPQQQQLQPPQQQMLPPAPQQQQLQPPPPQQQQQNHQAVTTGFFPSAAVGFFGQHPTPLPRQ